jgi:nucleotide-binding universal stress UspA family protein
VTAGLLTLLARPESAPALLAATAAAAACHERPATTVLHVRHDPQALILAPEEVLTERRRAALEAAETARAALLHKAVERWRAAAGAASGARWIDEVGTVEGSLRHHGGGAALLVLGHQPQAMHEDDRAAIKTALFELRRPVLLVPAGWTGSVGSRVLIAWKPSEQAARAVAAAGPFLARAERVTALAVRRPGQAGETSLLRALGPHAAGVPLESVEPGGGPAGALLLREARAHGIDLLVAGAYSHSRAYEFVLGGVTRHLLHHADLPVLMAH